MTPPQCQLLDGKHFCTKRPRTWYVRTPTREIVGAPVDLCDDHAESESQNLNRLWGLTFTLKGPAWPSYPSWKYGDITYEENERVPSNAWELERHTGTVHTEGASATSARDAYRIADAWKYVGDQWDELVGE